MQIVVRRLILDFGCGDGKWLKENGGSFAVGIDVDKKLIKLAKYNVKNGTSLIVADGCHLPFKNGCFDYVHVRLTLHHIKGYKNAILEISRVLKGIMYLEEAVDDYFLIALARRLVRNWRGMPVHSFFRSDNLINVLRENSFKILKVGYKSYLLLSHLISYFSIKSKFVSYLDYLYDSILHSLHLSKYFASRVQIIASSKGGI